MGVGSSRRKVSKQPILYTYSVRSLSIYNGSIPTWSNRSLPSEYIYVYGGWYMTVS